MNAGLINKMTGDLHCIPLFLTCIRTIMVKGTLAVERIQAVDVVRRREAQDS